MGWVGGAGFVCGMCVCGGGGSGFVQVCGWGSGGGVQGLLGGGYRIQSWVSTPESETGAPPGSWIMILLCMDPESRHPLLWILVLVASCVDPGSRYPKPWYPKP